MVRKKVPEWLNSTMWSTPPPPSSYDDGLLRHSPVTKMKEEAESISVAPRLNSAPPPSSNTSVPSPSHRPRNGNSISGGSGEYGHSVGPSAEDFSRQAHVSAEVNATFLFCFINANIQILPPAFCGLIAQFLNVIVYFFFIGFFHSCRRR